MDYNNRIWTREIETRNRKQWAIEKQTRRTCFGSPGFVDEWVNYSLHDSEEDAQKELKRLQNFADPLAHESYKIVDRSNERWEVRY